MQFGGVWDSKLQTAGMSACHLSATTVNHTRLPAHVQFLLQIAQTL